MLKTNIGRLRIVGFLEGISYLALLGVCMPLKYIWGIPEATAVVGMAHGILFIIYCVLVMVVIEAFGEGQRSWFRERYCRANLVIHLRHSRSSAPLYIGFISCQLSGVSSPSSRGGI